MKGKEEVSANLNRIERTKRKVLGRSHNSPATDVAEPGILVKTRIAQQEVSLAANVD